MKAVEPELTEVLAVRTAFTRLVPPEFEDRNRHMNVMRYFQLHGEAMWQLHHRLGFGEVSGFGLFASEQHLTYYREVLVGQEVSVHLCDLGRTDKAVHGISYLVNRTAGEIANSFEFLSVNVDLATRRPAALPDPVARRLDESIARTRALGFGPEHGVLELRGVAAPARD